MKIANQINLVFCLLFLTAKISHAAIPPYWMVLSRTSDLHGKGVVEVVQKVTLTTKNSAINTPPTTESKLVPSALAPLDEKAQAKSESNENTLVLTEKWWVIDDSTMKVEVVGVGLNSQPIQTAILYSHGKKYFFDENGKKRVEKIPEDFLENFFFYRVSKEFKNQLVNKGIVPAASLKSLPVENYSPKSVIAPEPWMRLARIDGVVAYAIGTPTDTGDDVLLPGLWISQDLFQVLKVRTKNQVTVNASKYKNFGADLSFPMRREVQWSNGTATMETTSVRTYAPTATLKEFLSPSKMELQMENATSVSKMPRQFPDNSLLTEFYSRLR